RLDRLFMPQNVAIVGASPKTGAWVQGNNYILGAIRQGFKGKLYPVHPSGENILGFQSYKRVREIPGDVDLVIFAIPIKAVLEVMADCVEKGVQFVHLFTAGFSETGIAAHADTEKKVLEIAEKNGIRILGPNCMGIHCTKGGLSFQPFYPETSGTVGFFSQSGQLAGYFLMMGAASQIRFSKVVSFGNALDLKAHEFLSYLAGDPDTEVIGSYLEGLTDGRQFFEIAREVTRRKPLIIFKGGQTKAGARAIQSHTAAIAGSDEIWKAMCRQAGIISVDSLQELVCTISAFQKLPGPKGNRIAILGGAGGSSVTMTDLAEKARLTVPRLSPNSVEKMRELIPLAGHSVLNPLDVGMEAFQADTFSKIISCLREDPGIDALFFMQTIGVFYRFMGKSGVRAVTELTVKISDQLQKPLYLVVEKDDVFGGQEYIKEVIERYQESGLPVFPNFEMAAKTLNNLWTYQQYLSSIDE
ncbi:CoA-binding protein, partial [bacterium]|nr:CoA-binding protein [bacterium]